MADNIPNFKCAIPSTTLNNALFGGQSAYSLLGPDGIPQTALANLGAGVRPNLLDNAYFIGGGSQQGGGQLPINQQGQTSYVARGYSIDRWRLANSDMVVDVSSDGVSITDNGTTHGWLQHILQDPTHFAGKTVTFSILLSTTSDAEIRATIQDAASITSGHYVTNTVPINANTVSLISVTHTVENGLTMACIQPWTYGVAFKAVAAKLEEGPNQTLAYKDSTGAWKLLPQPDMDYGAQLLKCQRYLFNPISRVDAVAPIGYGWVQTDTTAVIYVPTPPMRPGVNSVLIQSGTLYIESTSGAGPGAIAATGIELNTQTDNMAKLLVTGSGFPVGQGAGLQVRDRNAVLMFSRQL